MQEIWIRLRRSKSTQQHQHRDRRQSSSTREWSSASGKGNMGPIRANSPPKLTAGHCLLFKELCKTKMEIIYNATCSPREKKRPRDPRILSLPQAGCEAQRDPSELAAQPLSPLLRAAPTGSSAAGGEKLPGRGRRGQTLPNNARVC